MKPIRWSTIMSGLLLALFALGVMGTRARAKSPPSFAGAFTLPLETHWGAMTLPAGGYSLEYGGLSEGEPYVVTITGKENGSLRGMVLAGPRDDAPATKNALLCIRVGDTLYVRALEMPAIGESVHFGIPHAVEVESKVIARHQNQKGNTQLAQVAIGIERVPTH